MFLVCSSSQLKSREGDRSIQTGSVVVSQAFQSRSKNGKLAPGCKMTRVIHIIGCEGWKPKVIPSLSCWLFLQVHQQIWTFTSWLRLFGVLLPYRFLYNLLFSIRPWTLENPQTCKIWSVLSPVVWPPSSSLASRKKKLEWCWKQNLWFQQLDGDGPTLKNQHQT